MRTGFRLFIAAVAISVLLHLAALLGVGLSGRPTPLEALPQEAVTVDIVTPDEVSPELKPTLAGSAAARLPSPPPQTRTPRQVPPPPAPRMEGAAPPPPERSPFDPAALADIFRVSPVATTQATPAANAAASGFDAPADQVTGLPRADVAAFKAHLRKCLTLPAGVTPADKLRVVFRIGLKRDGALSTPPTLVEASASPNGPAMARSVGQALRQCQPYGFLPAEKYDEWKQLDLSITPRDVAGE
jgi:hypothetical protein